MTILHSFEHLNNGFCIATGPAAELGTVFADSDGTRWSVISYPRMRAYGGEAYAVQVRIVGGRPTSSPALGPTTPVNLNR